MFPPESTTATGPSPGHLPLHQRRDPDGAGALDDELRPLEQQHDRLGDVVAGDLDDVVEQLVEDRRRQLPRLLDRDPVREREAVGRGAQADHLRLRASPRERRRDPRREPAAADRDEHGLGLRHLLGELEPDRPLPGDDDLVLVGMDERRAGLLDVPARASRSPPRAPRRPSRRRRRSSSSPRPSPSARPAGRRSSRGRRPRAPPRRPPARGCRRSRRRHPPPARSRRARRACSPPRGS